jgi:hypothetical protein
MSLAAHFNLDVPRLDLQIVGTHSIFLIERFDRLKMGREWTKQQCFYKRNYLLHPAQAPHR